MANAITLVSVERGNKQFQGAFSEMWAVNATPAFDTGITAAAEATFTLTVPGVTPGDMVIGYSFGGADTEPNIFLWNVSVSAANTLEIAVTNASGSTDTPLPTTFKALIGRPSW